MRRFLCLPLIALLLGAAPPPKPQRIVSLNLCADQYLLALADPGQIAALTQFARDPQMSAGAAAAARLPVSKGTAEEVLALRPDLLIATPGRRRETMARLKGRNIATLDLPSAESYADIKRQVREVAAAVGHPERGTALIARMDAQLARIPATGRGRVAAYYQRRGFLTGTGTLVDELMRRTGLVNLAGRLDASSLARVPLERMALARPDFLVVESATDRVVDQGTEMLHHPVLGATPRLKLPQAWTVCGGPAYVRAAASLSRQVAAVPVRATRG
ncbi:ABC transporter substrate-binding protein [Sphingomonas jatrophae]|uniref:Iron complex transport system substrate-binding protein n=1 Tax=Sphingomonas jatrophae TaxID=1166337 RepID=A0A1I6JBG3_9SPHN|nr:ABC transporter substrate-binding protein [Sphingomonas jatrophae]SFR76282.1 iron complex transport system substrate-binding protein [Sphingomonas jatrophae]